MVNDSSSVAAPDNSLRQAIALLRAGRWEEGRTAAAAVDSGQADGTLCLLLALAKVRSGEARLDHVTIDMVRRGDPDDMHRVLVSPWVKEGRLADAVAALDIAIAANPPALAELRQRAGLNGRLGRWDAAIADADAAAAGAVESDPSLLTSRIQYRLQGGRIDDALALVRSQDKLPDDERLINIVLLTLIRQKQFHEAADFAEQIDHRRIADEVLAGNVVQALFRAGRLDAAIDIGELMIESLLDGPALRSHLAQAWYDGGPAELRFAKAIEHLEAGVKQAPDDVRMISLLGDLLLRSGKTAQAIPHLRKTLELQPKLSQTRALYARALKQAGHYQEAADEFARMISDAPDGGGRWQRYAAGALSQAGRRDEAAEVFDGWVARRGRDLPATFEEGLEGLWAKVDSLKIPKARLDWAWSLRAPDCQLDRAEWERRAKWGHLADHYLLDWLECRDQQVEEAMHKFADELDRVEAFIAESRARAPGKGNIFASAHVGAMYFGPLALELIGERSRWLASTPSVARTSYAETLISTSDQTDAQVARAFMQSLKDDNIVVVVADGAINLAAPRIPFEGQEITYSSFSARTAYRMGVPSAFVAPVWREGYHLGFMLEHLPMPGDGETVDEFDARWQEAYLANLRRFLALPPENLRLSGGIWRHIR